MGYVTNSPVPPQIDYIVGFVSVGKFTRSSKHSKRIQVPVRSAISVPVIVCVSVRVCVCVFACVPVRVRV